MATPGNGTLYIDKALTSVSIEKGKNTGYLSDIIFPVVSSQSQTGKVWRIDNNQDSKRQLDTIRAPGAEAKVLEIDTDSDTTYSCKDHAITGLVTDEEVAQAEAPVMPALQRVQQAVEALALDKEIAAESALETALASYKWTGAGTAGVYYWDDDTNGNFIANINDGITAVKETQGAGRPPNLLAMDEKVLRKLMQTQEFQDRAKYTMGPAATTASLEQAAALLANMVGVARVVYCPAGLKNTAKKGQSATVSSIWGENVFLLYVEPSPGFQTASFGVTVVWNGQNAGVSGGYSVERTRLALRKSDGVIVNRYYDQKVLSATSGYWFANVLT